MTEKGKVREMC